MTQSWLKTDRLAPRDTYEAAAREVAESTAESIERLENWPRCADILRVVLKDHGDKLNESANLLKPGAKPYATAVGKFRPNPTLAAPSNEVILFIALTKLEKSNGIFSFCKVPADVSTPQDELEEEVVEIQPGEGVLWRGDSIRKAGQGHGGTMLVIQYN
ncbi:hypothetical protein LTR56_023369 [Elasticomyces elasticus]|nr:hypothetical protein LTR56_023369 [Elasticomyces elasticus]KAK3623922.1 hypothetical protein LTR22_024172 [Elasticomyces elasticus]KAK4906244.1 hypothetical protein LTR49_024577 [Elasticomyces elasticus]